MKIDIEKIKVQEPAEIKKLVKHVVDTVHVVVKSYVHNLEDAEEVIQDTIITTIDNIGKFDNRASLKTWIYRIAINKSKDLLKYKKRQKRAGVNLSLNDSEIVSSDILKLGDYYDPGKMLESKEQLEILFNAINQLPPNQKEAITLTKLEQLSMKEVAEIMNVTPKAVEGLISRSKSNLKKYLESEGITMYKNRNNG